MTTLTIDQLLRENEDLRRRLEEAEDALRALRAGEVDAVLVEAEREQVYTLETADKPYRLLVEQMPHAAATLTADGDDHLLQPPLRRAAQAAAALIARQADRRLRRPRQPAASRRPCCATAKPPRSRGRSSCSGLTARRCRSTSASAPCRKAPSGCA